MKMVVVCSMRLRLQEGTKQVCWRPSHRLCLNGHLIHGNTISIDGNSVIRLVSHALVSDVRTIQTINSRLPRQVSKHTVQ